MILMGTTVKPNKCNTFKSHPASHMTAFGISMKLITNSNYLWNISQKSLAESFINMSRPTVRKFNMLIYSNNISVALYHFQKYVNKVNVT